MLTDTSATAGAQGGDLGQPPSTIDFITALFAHTTEPAYVCSFPNERHDETQAGERHVMTRLPKLITSFLAKWDRSGRGMFVCVATINGDKRNKQTVCESTTLFADLDFDKIDGLPNDPQAARDYVLKQLTRLKFAPSIIVWSGGGMHLYWLFKEALATQDHIERIEALLCQLADATAGDLAVCEVARVLRLPGSHNTKRGDMRPVEIIELHPDRRYHIEELEEWLSEQSPVMLRKAREFAKTAGENEADDPFLQYAHEVGYKPPIDVQQRLEQMMYMGGDDSSVHQTQLQCSASLLSRGTPKDEVVALLMNYTRRAAGSYGSRWNWKHEERNIVRICDDWLKKHPQTEKPTAKPKFESINGGKSEQQEDEQGQQQERAQAAGGAKASAGGGGRTAEDDNVVQFPQDGRKKKDVPAIVVGG
ncbi:hypothetical protein ACVWXO_010746 [Bradyrhizobium sp. LM2.7]